MSNNTPLEQNGIDLTEVLEKVNALPSGGITPSGSVTLTEENTYDVTDKATAVVDMSAKRASIAEVITSKGVDTLPDSDWDTLETNIGLIEQSGSGYGIGEIILQKEDVYNLSADTSFDTAIQTATDMQAVTIVGALGNQQWWKIPDIDLNYDYRVVQKFIPSIVYKNTPNIPYVVDQAQVTISDIVILNSGDVFDDDYNTRTYVSFGRTAQYGVYYNASGDLKFDNMNNYGIYAGDPTVTINYISENRERPFGGSRPAINFRARQVQYCTIDSLKAIDSEKSELRMSVVVYKIPKSEHFHFINISKQ